jgi:hypothetical protein
MTLLFQTFYSSVKWSSLPLPPLLNRALKLLLSQGLKLYSMKFTLNICDNNYNQFSIKNKCPTYVNHYFKMQL